MIKRVGIILLSTVLISNSCYSSELQNIYIGASKSIVGYNDGGGNAYKINTGYTINENFSLEVNYLSFGENSPFDGVGKLLAKGYSVDVLAKYPINDFSFYAKLGNMWWTEEGERTLWWEPQAPVKQLKNNGSDIIYGIGASYNINDNFSIKIEYLESQVNNQTANPFSIGVDYIF